MLDSFEIGVSALNSLQTAIRTTGQNIANVSTEGYSRQTVNFTTNPPNRQNGFYLGAGVTISSIERAYDELLTRDVRNRTASSSLYTNLAESAGRVDELFADQSVGLGPALSEFFSALQAASNSPTTLPERQVLVSQADTLAQRFGYFDNRLSDFQTDLNAKVSAAVTDVNQYAEVIAELNGQISVQTAQNEGFVSGDLLDQRDEAIRQLSALVKTRVQPQDDGALNVFIGQGQPLLIGSNASSLSAQADPLRSNRVNVFLNAPSGQAADITDFLSGGSIGASLQAYDDVIEPVRRGIGVLAAGLTVTFNEVHSQGYDLNDNTNVAFFRPEAAETAFFASDGNTGVTSVNPANMTAVIYDSNPLLSGDISQVTGDSYQLDYDAGDLNVTNLTTGEITTYAAINGGAAFSTVVDGVRVSISAATISNLASGDSFILEPIRTSAEKFGVAITNADEVALAQTTGSPGDNSNALALLDLQGASTLAGGANYFDSYASTTNRVAVQARRASSLAEAETSLLTSATARQSNVTGVNLEEEATSLIRLQQAYQAAAQIISTSREVFDTLLRATQ